MPAQRKTIYLVEGEDEKKIVQMLISDFRFVRPGKVYVMNILQRKVTKARAATWGENVSVILIFDTDVMRTNIFDQNLAMLKKLSNVRDDSMYVYISTENNRICRPVPLVEGKLRNRPGYHTLFFKA